MKYDSYSRFLKSQMYKDCIVNEMEGKPILAAITSNSNSNNSSKKLSKTSNHKTKLNENLLNNQLVAYSNSSNSPSTNPNDNTTTNNSTNNNSNTNSTTIPNASSNIAAAVAVVASTGAAVITNVPCTNQNDNTSHHNFLPSQLNLHAATNYIQTSNHQSPQSLSPTYTNTNTASSSSSSSSTTSSQFLSPNNPTNSTTPLANDLNRKEKKRSTILPWTKGN